MAKKLLVTDSFFINQDQINELKASGYEVIHLDKPSATEEELIHAIQDISVYILGGIEQVTQPVIDAANNLEAIIFPGVDYDKFIPAADYAKEKGVHIYNAPGVNTVTVAEFAIGVALLMQRRLVQISRAGEVKGAMTGSIEGSIVGIVGAGNIGKKLVECVALFNPAETIIYNRSKVELAARQVELEELVQSADIIFVALPMKAGQLFTTELIGKIKTNSLMVSISPLNIFDMNALLERVRNNEVRAAIDWPNPNEDLAALPLERWYTVNAHSAYNTQHAIKAESDYVLAQAKELL